MYTIISKYCSICIIRKQLVFCLSLLRLGTIEVTYKIIVLITRSRQKSSSNVACNMGTHSPESWTLTMELLHKFKDTQVAMERMLVPLPKILLEIIGERAKVTDIAWRISYLNWQWADLLVLAGSMVSWADVACSEYILANAMWGPSGRRSAQNRQTCLCPEIYSMSI